MTQPPPPNSPDLPAPGTYPAIPYPPAPSPPGRAARYAVLVVLAVVIVGYAAVAILARSVWSDPPPQDRTSVTFSARSPDGSPPSPDALAQAEDVLGKRAAAMGLSVTEKSVDGDRVTVTTTGADADALREVGDGGRLYMRPVIHAIPTAAGSPTSPAPSVPSQPPPNLAQHIADEKELRQSTDQQVQILALHFQATRCAEEDTLAGNDDPNLPLITCAEDGETVYLLDKSIISGDQIVAATAQADNRSGENTVMVNLDDAAAQTFETFTEANVGTQVAYTIDTQVVSAPEIREAIPDGLVMVTGGFSASNARALAATLSAGTLPVELTFESSTTEQAAVEAGWTLPRVALFAGGAAVLLVVIAGTAYLIASRKRKRALR